MSPTPLFRLADIIAQLVPPDPDPVDPEIPLDILEPSSQLLFSSYSKFPYFKDWANTYTKRDLGGPAIMLDDEKPYMPIGYYLKNDNFPYKENLNIKGPLTIRTVVQFTGEILRSMGLAHLGNSGETEGANFPYLFQVLSNGMLWFISEHSGGINIGFKTDFLPQLIGKTVCLEARRDASRNVTLYVNGHNITYNVNSVENSVVGDGFVTANLDPTGGESTLFMTSALSDSWGQPRAMQIKFLHIFNTDEVSETPMEAAIRLGCVFQPPFINKIIIPESKFTDAAADPNAIAVIKPTETELIDVTGNMNPLTQSTYGGVQGWDGKWWRQGGSDANYTGPNNSLIHNMGSNFTIDFIIDHNNSNSAYRVVETFAVRKSDATNIIFLITISTNSISVISERGSGINNSAGFIVPHKLNTFRTFEYRVCRQDIGEGMTIIRCYYKGPDDEIWVPMSKDTYHTGYSWWDYPIESPSGGDETNLRLASNSYHKLGYAAIYSDCKIPVFVNKPEVKYLFVPTPKSLVGLFPIEWRNFGRGLSIQYLFHQVDTPSSHSPAKTDKGIYFNGYSSTSLQNFGDASDVTNPYNGESFSIGAKFTPIIEDFSSILNTFYCCVFSNTRYTSTGRGAILGIREVEGSKILSFYVKNNAGLLYELTYDLDAAGYVVGDEITVCVNGDGTTARMWVNGTEVDSTTYVGEAGNSYTNPTLGTYTPASYYKGYIKSFLYDETEIPAVQIEDYLNITEDGDYTPLP